MVNEALRLGGWYRSDGARTIRRPSPGSRTTIIHGKADTLEHRHQPAGARADRVRGTDAGSRSRRRDRAVGGDPRWARPGLCRRGRNDPRSTWTADRHRHGQVRPCRPQDRGDLRLHRHARLFRASGRSEPRRPRHDHTRRRDHGAVLVGRDRRAEGPHRLFPPLQDRTDCRHRLSRQRAGAGCRRGGDAATGARGLPAQSRAYHLDADAAGARRCARDRAPGEPRLHGGEVRRAASGRAARRHAEVRARRDAQRRGDAATFRSAPACRRRCSR